MIKASETQLLEIYDSGAHKIGTVIKPVYIPGEKRIRGLLYKPASLLKQTRFLPVSNIVAIEKPVVLVKDKLDKVEMKKSKSIDDASKLKVTVLQNGSNIGYMSDYYVDFKGYVKAVEVSESFLEDMMHGRKIETEFGRLEFSNDIH